MRAAAAGTDRSTRPCPPVPARPRAHRRRSPQPCARDTPTPGRGTRSSARRPACCGSALPWRGAPNRRRPVPEPGRPGSAAAALARSPRSLDRRRRPESAGATTPGGPAAGPNTGRRSCRRSSPARSDRTFGPPSGPAPGRPPGHPVPGSPSPCTPITPGCPGQGRWTARLPRSPRDSGRDR